MRCDKARSVRKKSGRNVGMRSGFIASCECDERTYSGLGADVFEAVENLRNVLNGRFGLNLSYGAMDEGMTEWELGSGDLRIAACVREGLVRLKKPAARVKRPALKDGACTCPDGDAVRESPSD